MAQHLNAWLIGATAPGIAVDLGAWTTLLAQSNASVTWLCSKLTAKAAGTHAVTRFSAHANEQPAIASAESIAALFEEARQTSGPRLIWLGGHAEEDAFGDGYNLVTEERGPNSLSAEKLWRALNALAARGDEPLTVIIDVCHFAPPPGFEPNRKLIAIVASAGDETARSTDGGGALSQALRHAIEAGETTVGQAVDSAIQQLERKQTIDLITGNQAHRQRPLVVGIGPTRPVVRAAPHDPIAAYLAWLPSQFKRLSPLAPRHGKHLLDAVHVQVNVDCRRNPETALRDGLPQGAMPLEDLLARAEATRWVILGEPGAGKSTLARFLTRAKAGSGGAVIPVYVPLGRLVGEGAHPFDLMERDLAAAQTQAVARGLAAALRDASARIWLFLDGLDELGMVGMATGRQRIEDLSEALPDTTLVVLSRRIGYDEDAGLPGFEHAYVQRLSPSAQKMLLTNWEVPDPADLLARIEAIDALRPLARVPLLLTLIAVLARDGRALPSTRTAVYREAIEYFLARGYGGAPRGLKAVYEARQVLQRLSLALLAGGETAWTEGHVIDTLHLLEAGQCPPDVPEQFTEFLVSPLLHRQRQSVAKSPSLFVKDIAQVTGIIAPHGGGDVWGYLHKGLQDALCAELLVTATSAQLGALVEHLAKVRGGLERWAETFAQTCAQHPQPLALLQAFGEHSEELLLLRAAPDVDGVEPRALLKLVMATKRWDGEHLLAIAHRWQDSSKGVSALVKAAQDGDLETAARVHYALSEAEAEFDNATFFESIGRPQVERPTAARELVELVAGTFQMGSTTISGDEQPVHPVTVSPFALGRTTVTKAQFAEFDPDHTCPGDADHPVTRVSWYVARLFCIWAGGRLPTEAEWEYACRAGSTSAYCFGDDPAELDAYAWQAGEKFDSRKRPQPVAKKQPNAWGLYDLHGNVWEWCADWYGDYGAEPMEDPTGPAGGSNRVGRGGVAWEDAEFCRSAYRRRLSPRRRVRVLGFRLARSAPPQLDSGS